MKWEYKIIRVAFDNIQSVEDYLNTAGHDGWECFAVNLDMSFYFKRPVHSLLNENVI